MSTQPVKSVSGSTHINKSYWRLFAILCTSVIGIFIWSGSLSSPADPTIPIQFYGSVPQAALTEQTFRVGLLNIHGGKGDDRIRDLDRTADCLHNLDFAGLYEVRSSFNEQHSNQAAILGNKLGMSHAFIPTVHRWWHNCFGNGVLTRIKLESCLRIPLPGTSARRTRNAVLASFKHQGKTVRVLSTHLDTKTDHDTQLKAVCEIFMALQEPAILMGDLNTKQNDPQLKKLLEKPGVVDALRETLDQKNRKSHIDWIITRGLKTVHVEFEPTVASDHPVVRVELELLERDQRDPKSHSSKSVDLAREPTRSQQ